MESIIKKQNDNIGSIREIIFVPMANVQDMPNYSATDMIDSSEIELNLAGWYRFHYTPDTGSYKEEMKNVPGGVVYETTIEMQVPKDSLNRFVSFFAMEHHEFLVLVRDHNYVSHLVGGIDVDGARYGMKFKTLHNTSENRTGFNRVDCQFNLESRFKPSVAFNFLDLEFIPEPPHYTGDTPYEEFDPED